MSNELPYGEATPHVGASDDDRTGATTEPRAVAESATRTGFRDSELVIGLVAAVGTDLGRVRQLLAEFLNGVGYAVHEVRITQQVISALRSLPEEFPGAFERFSSLMDAGNEARKLSGDNSILAKGAISLINTWRRRQTPDGRFEHRPRVAHLISAVKHPKEVEQLRATYPQGFHLIGVHADETRRRGYLVKALGHGMSEAEANRLMDRDRDEQLDWGQRVADAFHLADIFVRLDESHDRLRRDLGRIVELLFGHPFVTPTFDEYAMFLAFAASLRSADLSRQVGAVVAVDEQIVATGANDCPRAEGGLYWPVSTGGEGVYDVANGRDYMRGADSNRVEQQRIIDDIVLRTGFSGADEERLRSALASSRIRDLTEFGRVVHAEMEALLSCARARVPVKGGDLFSTTFPCHNCAKHIIAAGIRRVVFIEPYPKSKALEFHDDSIALSGAETEGDPSCQASRRVRFEPFVGIGPRRFVDLFSTRLGSGYPLKRKGQDGRRLAWPEKGRSPDLRLQMLPMSYLELEQAAAVEFEDAAAALGKREER